MAERNQMYRALRGQKSSFPPQTAPIAAKFEDCQQNFERLCIVLRSGIRLIEPNIIEDSYGRFLAWGRDCGADDRSVDHRLRKNSSLSTRTLELLKTLSAKLEQVIEVIQNAATASVRSTDDQIAAEMSASLPGSEDILRREPEIQENSRVTLIMKIIDGLVSCLAKLMPNLCDPFPIDTYSEDSTPNDADTDIDLATALFPTATHSLIFRLAWANSRRRKYLKNLQDKRRPGMPLAGVKVGYLRRAKKSPDVATDAFNFQKPGLKAESPPHRPYLPLRHSYAVTSDDGDSSVVESLFSPQPTITYGSATDPSIAAIEPATVVKQQTVPKPPVSLDAGQPFLCPYCHDEMNTGNNITTTSDWEGHVFNDLEPYMCTFDGCLRAEKTFGIREEWFRHELETHRITKVWACRSCVREFDTAKSFEAHLQNKHNNIAGPSQMAMMVKLCMKHSEKRPKEEICPLCAMKLSVEALKGHIANHLEQLALTSVNGDDSSEENDSDEIGSQKFDDNASEGRTKLEILNDFVEEQLGYVLPDKKGPADKDMDESNLDFVRDSDDEGSDDESGVVAPSIKRETRDWKLKSYLGDKSAKLQNRGNRRSGWQLETQGKPKPSSSSGGSTAPVRTAPHPRDDDYVGRDGDLATLYKILSLPARICTINGTGGIGKTATAVEFTYRYEQAYSYIFWTQAETKVGCADTYSLIAVALGLAPDGEDQKQLVELSRDFLQKTEKRWLLVFDNVDQWADIEAYIPRNMNESKGSILITTRVAALEPKPMLSNYFSVNLKEMSTEESTSLLIQGIQSDLKYEQVKFHPEYKIAVEIALLAGLPLALSHIAGYVKSSGCTLAEFLELWNEWRKASLSARPADTSSNEALETVWSIGLSDLGADALKLLKIMAFLDSDVIQRELLMNDHTSPTLAFLKSNQIIRCRRLIQDLLTRKLISLKRQDSGDTYSIHRLLQHRLLHDLEENPGERQEIFCLAFELIRERLPRPSLDAPNSMKWNIFKEYIPHVLTIQRVYHDALPMIKPFIGLAELFRDGGVHLWQRGLIYDGLRLLNSAEAILDRLECEEDQLRIDIHIATALLIQYFGISHRAESRNRFWKVLQIREKLASQIGPANMTKDDEMTLCNSLADYGNALLQFNNYKEAEPIYQKCHAKYQEWGTEEEIHFEYAKFNHHMAFCRMYHEDFKGAIRLAERAVELVSRQNGQPQLTLRFKFDLACIILQSGDLEKALEVQKQILKARLSLQGNGKMTYFTLQSYYAVGAGYSHLGRLEEAEHMMRTALKKAQERADKGFWPDAAIARAEFHLSQVLRAAGKDDAEAEGLAAKARSVLSRLLPYDPLDGVTTEDELALFDHLQPVFGGRFTGTTLLKYVV